MDIVIHCVVLSGTSIFSSCWLRLSTVL